MRGGRPVTGVDLDRLAEELDERLEAADAALARLYPGARPGRQPVHTVYVPADRFHAGLVPAYGAQALRAVDEHEDLFLDVLGGDRALVDRVRDKLGREPVEDLRIDFEDGYGTRSDEEEDDAVRRERDRPAQVARRRDGPGRPRHPVQELRGPHPATRPAHPGPLPRRPRPRRPAPGGLRRHPAQGHLRRPGRGAGPRRRPPRVRAGPRGGVPALRDPGRDAAVGARTRRHRPRRPDGPRVGGPLHRPALRHLRLLRVLRHRGRPPEPRAPGGRPRQGGHAGGRRRHRRTPVRRVDQRPAGGHARPGGSRVAQPPAPRPAVPRAWLLPGLGPAPRPAADAVRRDVRVLPGRARRRGDPAAQLRRPAGVRRPRRAGHRPRAGRLRAPRPRLRGRCRRPRSGRPAASTTTHLSVLAHRAPTTEEG